MIDYKSIPAFPVNIAATPSGDIYHSDEVFEGSGGMTLRDYFAGQAVISLTDDYQSQPEHLAERAYKIADAMLKEREK